MTERMSVASDLRCIWCGQSSGEDQPEEHIVPEAIGCPEGFTLTRGEVCGPCNHGLAHLDQALVADLEVYAMMAGVPRKGGRDPKISSYGNFKATSKDGHMTAYFNMDPKPAIMPDGETLAAYRGKPRDVKATFTPNGNNEATITYEVSFGTSPKVARALVKMGAEYFCSVQGREMATGVIAGPVADFVRHGKGQRPLILGAPDETKYEHRFGAIGLLGDKGWYCVFRLAHFEVMVDLGPDRAVFDEMSSRMYASLGRTGWTTLPPSAFIR